ncbi:MAG: 5-bromo-4-chloroindolyl phosphate hydrolysis family protein [Defluviitaleaceae bacterium]|nr:5-bromo-4-chloroindolyl phosphate hydrolysis family protein [Defluviitaleaceae bacterium]
MKCYIHSDREAMALCTICGKPICSECHISVDNKSNCFNCIKKEMAQEVEEVPKKSVLLTIFLTFFPFFPVGFNFLYLGRPIKAMVFLSINLILLAVFWPLHFFVPTSMNIYAFMNIYIFITLVLRFITYIVCLVIINKTHKIYTLGYQIFIVCCLMLVSCAFFVLTLTTGFVGFPGIFQDSFDYWEIPVSMVIVGFVWALSIVNRRNKKKVKKVARFELPQIPEPVQSEQQEDSGNENAELHRLYSDLKRHERDLKDSTICPQLTELSETTNKIIEFVEKYPHKSRNINKFVDYYLPTTNKLLDNYKHLKEQGRSGENINKATEKIEELLEVLQKAYNNQLDSLFEDKALDIDAEVSVLKSILEKEGLLNEDERK